MYCLTACRRTMCAIAAILVSLALAAALVPLAAIPARAASSLTTDIPSTLVDGTYTVSGNGDEASTTVTITPEETAFYTFTLSTDDISLAIYWIDGTYDENIRMNGPYGDMDYDDVNDWCYGALLSKGESYSLKISLDYSTSGTITVAAHSLSVDYTISAGETVEGTISTYGGINCYSFTPDTSACYRFHDTTEGSNFATLVFLFDSSWKLIAADYGPLWGDTTLSAISASLDAGSTYYLAVSLYSMQVNSVSYNYTAETVTSLSEATATLDESSYEFTGKSVIVYPTVTSSDGEVLVYETDYRLKWSNNLCPGTATVTVYGYGYDCGWDTTVLTCTYTITAPTKSLTTSSSLSFSLSGDSDYGTCSFTVPATGSYTFTWKSSTSVDELLICLAESSSSSRNYYDYNSNTLSFTEKLTGGVTCYVSCRLSEEATGTLSVARTWTTNPITVSGKTVKVKGKYAKGKKSTKKSVSVKASKTISVKKAQGKVTYSKLSGTSKIVVNKKTGKLTVKAGIKRGTYKIRVRAKAAGNVYYSSGSKTVTVTVKVV